MPRTASPGTEIQSLLRRLSDLIPALVRDAEFGRQVRRLTGGPAAASAPRAATAGRKPRGRRPGLDPAKVLEALKGGKPMSLGDVAKHVGESNKDRVGSALRKLRDEGKAKVKGDRGAARWFAA